LPRVVKRKMSNFPRKRVDHRYWPQPTKPPDQAVVIVARAARGPETVVSLSGDAMSASGVTLRNDIAAIIGMAEDLAAWPARTSRR
jgi:hypothetical protein